MMRATLHEVTVEYQTQTDLAVCIREVEGGPDIWIPHAQCTVDPLRGDLLGGIARGTLVTLTASEQTLIDKGLL